MSCEFSLEHYAELLEAVREGGYRYSFFDHEPESGDLLLRHDVDLSLDAALRLAELEAQAGAAATYFLMTQSVFYNLASPEGLRAINRLRELGHAVGLHAVWPGAELDERFDPVVAWHNPNPDYMSEPLDGDRRGYVIALGGTNLEAVERAESAARLLDVEVEAA